MPPFQPPSIDLLAVLPLLIVSITAMVVLTVGLFVPREQGGALGAIGLVGVGGAFVAIVSLWGQNRVAFDGTILGGHLSARALRFVRDWAALHQEELAANWERARDLEPLERIAPLS